MRARGVSKRVGVETGAVAVYFYPHEEDVLFMRRYMLLEGAATS